MNDEIFQLITNIELIQSQNNVNTDIGRYFVFANMQYVVVNDVYYYLRENNVLYVYLQTEYIQFKILHKGKEEYHFEVRYCNLQNIYLKENGGF